ncbi:MAG: glycosyltransferase [Alphaproteobacteria bacterium]|nr:glycosyltransferase [Alphaproteobacteria bacterium]
MRTEKSSDKIGADHGGAARTNTAPARVCFPFIGDLIGGSYISSLLLAQHLDSSRYEPVIVLHEEGHFASELRKQGIAYDLVPLPGFVGTAPGITTHAKAIARTLPTLHRYIRRRGISIVHTNEWPLHQTWAAPTRLAGRTFIWHQRGMLSQSRLDTLLRARAHRVFCVSNYVLDQLPANLASRSAVVDSPFETEIDFGVNQAAARHTLRSELETGPDVPVVGYFGNLWDVKRPRVFVEAAAAINQALSGEAAFVIFGDDREGQGATLQADATASGLDKQLHFMGFRTPGTYWIAACDLMLAPAVGDAFPRTLVEAALAGVPVVAADAGGHPEIITNGETGILVAPDDPAAMAEAALALIKDPNKAHTIAAAAKAAALSRFSVKTHADHIQDLYDETLAAH